MFMLCSLLIVTGLSVVLNLIMYLLYRLIWRSWPPLRDVWPIMVLLWAVLCGMVITSHLHAADLPADPVQRVAAKALAGEYGVLEQWQWDGYNKAAHLGEPLVGILAWITVYNENCPGCNFITASGRWVSERVAAMIDVKWATWVLVDLDTGYQLRQVFDTGSRRNIWRAQNPEKCESSRRPAETWIDLYYSPAAMLTLKNKHNQSWVRSIYIF